MSLSVRDAVRQWSRTSAAPLGRGEPARSAAPHPWLSRVLRPGLVLSVALAAASIAAIAEPSTTLAATCTKTWTGGTSSSWSTGTNWSPAGAPGAADYACISSGSNSPTIPLATSISVAGVEQSGLTLTVDGTLTLTDTTGTLSSLLAGGTIGGSGTLTVNGTLRWTGGTMSGSGTTLIAATGTLDMDPASSYLYLERTLQNDGSAIYTPGPSGYGLYFSGGTATTFQNNGDFDYQGLAAGANDTSMLDGGFGTIVNAGSGTFTRSAGTGTSTISIPFDNDGAVTGAAGTLAFTGGGTSSGTFDTSGSGKVVLASGTYQLGGATVAGGGTLTLAGATIGGSGTLTVNGTLRWTSGTMSGSGKTLIAATGTLVMDPASSYLYLERTLQNDGSAIYTPGPSGYGLYFSGGTATTFQNNGDFDYQGPTTGSDGGMLDGGFGTIVNAGSGTFTRSAGAGTGTIAAAFDNEGTVTGAAGTLAFSGGGSGPASGTFHASGGARVALTGGTFVLGAGASFTGSGVTVDGERFHRRGHHGRGGATLTLAGGTIGGSGTLTVNGTLRWTGGTMSGSGTTLIAATGTLDMDPASSYLYLERTLQNDGSAIYTPGPSGYGLYFSGGTATTFQNNGDFDYQGLAAGANDTSMLDGGFGTIVNAGSGTFTRSAGTGTSTISIPFDNDGAVTGAAGTLAFTGGGTSSGTFDTSGSGKVVLASGTYQLGGATVAGGGTLTLAGATIGGSGTLTVNGTLRWTSGTMSGSGKTLIAATGTLVMDPASSYLYLDERTLQNDGSAIYTPGPSGYGLYFSGGTATTFQNNGDFDYQGLAAGANDTSMLDGGFGTIVNAGSGTFTRSAGTGTSTISIPFDNDGTVTGAAGTLAFTGSFPAYNAGTNTLAKGTYVAISPGQIQIAGLDVGTLSATVILDGVNAKLSNGPGLNGLRNLATISVGGKLTVRNGKVLGSTTALTNRGAVTIGGGANSSLAPGGNYTQAGGTTRLLTATSTLAPSGASSKVTISGGVLSGIGTVQASGTPSLTVNGTGTLAPGLSPGSLSVTGSYVQGATGTLAIEVDGTTAGLADKLAVSGGATIAGTLAITTGYTPLLGDANQIITAASVSGQFDTVSGADLPGNLSYQVKVNPGERDPARRAPEHQRR